MGRRDLGARCSYERPSRFNDLADQLIYFSNLVGVNAGYLEISIVRVIFVKVFLPMKIQSRGLMVN